MRYMMIVKGQELGNPPQELVSAIIALGEEATKAGVMVGMGGLLPTAKAARVRLSGGKITVTDGPFTEAKEVIGGFTTYELASMEEAIEWTKRFLALHTEYWPAWEGEVEIRPMA